MKIAIAGAGSIGTVVGVLLAQSHDVELIRRSGKFGKYVIEIVGAEEHQQEVEVLNSHQLGKNRKVDMIILTTQRHQSEILLNILEKAYLVNDKTIILALQNGRLVSHPIKSRFPVCRIVQGIVWWSATQLSDNQVYYHRKAPTYIGDITIGKEAVMEILSPFLEMVEVNDIHKEIHTKLLLNVVSPCLALIKEPYPQGLNNMKLRKITHIVFDDVVEVAKRMEWEIDDKLRDFHELLKSNRIVDEPDNKFTHKVSTQISAEKHGGKNSNAGALLGYFIMNGSDAANLILEYVSELPANYEPVSDDLLDELYNKMDRYVVDCLL